MGEVTKKETVSVVDTVSKKVSEYFAKKNAKSKVYSTSDGFVFENPVFARNHAATLDDKNVTPHKAAKNIDVIDSQELTGEDYQLTDEDKELLASGLDSKNYNAMRALVKNLQLETTDQKAETLIAALTAYKESL